MDVVHGNKDSAPDSKVVSALATAGFVVAMPETTLRHRVVGSSKATASATAAVPYSEASNTEANANSAQDESAVEFTAVVPTTVTEVMAELHKPVLQNSSVSSDSAWPQSSNNTFRSGSTKPSVSTARDSVFSTTVI